jgi:hypothetical protein
MWSTSLFTFSVCLFSRLAAGVQGQSIKSIASHPIVFDVLRNFSAVGANDTCARLACFVKEDSHKEWDIQHVISLVISETSETDNDQSAGKQLAGLSLFDTDIRVYGDPTSVSGTGKRWPKGGELHVNIKGAIQSCQSGVFTCELRFIDSRNKGHISKVDKRVSILKEVDTELETGAPDTETLRELRVFISDELTKISNHSESLISHVETAVQSVSLHLHRLEAMMAENLQSRLDEIDKKLAKIEMLLEEDATSRFSSHLSNSTESIKSLLNDRFDTLQNKISLLEVSIRNRTRATDNLINESSQRYLPLPVPCADLRVNLSTTISQVQNQLSHFTNEVIDKIAKADKISVAARLPDSLWKLLLEWRSPPAQRKGN